MSSEEIRGPLSAYSLSQLEDQPLSILPTFINQLNGCVGLLKRVSTWLESFEIDGWTWAVGSGDQGDWVVAHAPDSLHSLTIPLRVLVSGDVSALPTSSLSRTSSSQSAQEQEIVFEKEMDMAIKMLVRQSTCSSFGSFPSGPLKQAVNRIIRRR